MSTRFQVEREILLEDRNLLALTGVILEGMPDIGMTAVLEDPEPREFREQVHSVEFLEDDEGKSAPALTFEYRDRKERERWEAIGWSERVLRLEP